MTNFGPCQSIANCYLSNKCVKDIKGIKGVKGVDVFNTFCI